MTDQPVKRYYRNDACPSGMRQDPTGPWVLAKDYDRTDAARVEAERMRDSAYGHWQSANEANVKLAARVAELESRPEVIAQLEDEKRVLAERVAALESDLAPANHPARPRYLLRDSR